MRREKTFSIPRFLFELIIVFIGVYGAFELNRYQQGIREDKIRKNYFISFKSELTKLISNIRHAEEAINDELLRIESSADKNESFLPLYINFTESLLITQAGFNDDVFVQLDPGLASSLVGGYDQVKLLENKISQYHNHTTTLLGLRLSDLYDSSGSLKIEYGWYLKELNQLNNYLSQLGTMMQSQALPAVDDIIEDL
ncbi:hypothetical protein [Roseivirga sp.]|uniref:hypothetical protein n=1 Tax=Roseivirga sp. TaxID=1964215 RepID=UPI003B52E631